MSSLPVLPRILGIDVGRVRIGVAVSDELQLLAHPVETVDAVPMKAAAKRVAELARTLGVRCVVVGLPKHMNGETGISAEVATQFAYQVRHLAGCEIVMEDERMSTLAANRVLRSSGKSQRHSRGIVDQVAAQVILQSYLDRLQSAASAAQSASPNETLAVD